MRHHIWSALSLDGRVRDTNWCPNAWPISILQFPSYKLELAASGTTPASKTFGKASSHPGFAAKGGKDLKTSILDETRQPSLSTPSPVPVFFPRWRPSQTQPACACARPRSQRCPRCARSARRPCARAVPPRHRTPARSRANPRLARSPTLANMCPRAERTRISWFRTSWWAQWVQSRQLEPRVPSKVRFIIIISIGMMFPANVFLAAIYRQAGRLQSEFRQMLVVNEQY